MLSDVDRLSDAIRATVGDGIFVPPGGKGASVCDADYCSLAVFPASRTESMGRVRTLREKRDVSSLPWASVEPATPIADAVEVVVTNWVDLALLGTIDYTCMLPATSWDTQLRLIISAMERHQFHLATMRDHDGVSSSAGNERRILEVHATDPLPLTWKFSLASAPTADHRRVLIASLGSRLMRVTSAAVATARQEKERTRELEQQLVHLRAASASGTTPADLLHYLNSGNRDGEASRAPAAETQRGARPVNLLNPSQRVGAKRPRGRVRIGGSDEAPQPGGNDLQSA